jgi:hypothetical protein
MTKLLVCGSRTITNSAWIFSEIEKYISESNLQYSDIHIIEGSAKGVDKIAKQFADDRNIPAIEMPADWSIGKHAGILRNIKMYENTDEVLILWDGNSRGTRHTIGLCEKGNKPYTIIIYPYDFYDKSTIRKNYN